MRTWLDSSNTVVDGHSRLGANARQHEMETIVPEWKTGLRESQDETTRATAQLPGLDIDIIHRRSPEGKWEQVSISVRATPSFEPFGHLLDATNPFTFWMQAARLTWLPWLLTAQMMMLPPSAARPAGSKHHGR
jgi:hypothetical protein